MSSSRLQARVARRLIGAALAAAAAAPSFAQGTAGPPCQAPEHHQFDFWIGEWDVYTPDGKAAGKSRIEALDCALLEHWSGQGNVSGKSLNTYSRADRRWHQFWVDGSGTPLILVGGLVDKAMVLSSAAPGPAGVQRITWSVNDDGSVRQLWQSSKDGGSTWATQFDGKYVRRK